MPRFTIDKLEYPKGYQDMDFVSVKVTIEELYAQFMKLLRENDESLGDMSVCLYKTEKDRIVFLQVDWAYAEDGVPFKDRLPLNTYSLISLIMSDIDDRIDYTDDDTFRMMRFLGSREFSPHWPPGLEIE